MKNMFLMGTAFLMVTACATLSPRAEIESRFIEFGLGADRAGCLADELDERLNREDLNAVADFVAGLNAASSPGQALDALISIDNPDAAAAIARSTIACAF